MVNLISRLSSVTNCKSTYRGAALPKNTPNVPCIFDPLGRAGICGDWLLGSSVQSAALSGMALANHVNAFLYYKLSTLPLDQK